jgi:hypothetical protein
MRGWRNKMGKKMKSATDRINSAIEKAIKNNPSLAYPSDDDRIFTQADMDAKLDEQVEACAEVMSLYLLKIHGGITVEDAAAVNQCLNARLGQEF